MKVVNQNDIDTSKSNGSEHEEAARRCVVEPPPLPEPPEIEPPPTVVTRNRTSTDSRQDTLSWLKKFADLVLTLMDLMFCNPHPAKPEPSSRVAGGGASTTKIGGGTWT